MERRALEILGAPEGLRYGVVGQQGEEGAMATIEEQASDEVAGLVRYAEVRTSAIPPMDPEETAEAVAVALQDEPVRQRDAELVARVEARVAKHKLGEEPVVAVEDQALGQKFGEMMAEPLEPVQAPDGYPGSGMQGRAAYKPRELCEERSVIEAFLRDGGLTEREEGMARLWLRWDDVAQHKGPMPGTTGCVVGPEEAEGLRSRVYVDLAASYSRAVGRPASAVRSGADEGPRFGGLVLSKESVRKRDEEGARERVLTLEDMEEQVDRAFDVGGAPGPANVMAWLEEFVEMRGSEIAGELSRMGAYEETLRSGWVSLQRRKAVLEGQQLVVGALLREIEDRGG